MAEGKYIIRPDIEEALMHRETVEREMILEYLIRQQSSAFIDDVRLRRRKSRDSDYTFVVGGVIIPPI